MSVLRCKGKRILTDEILRFAQNDKEERVHLKKESKIAMANHELSTSV